MLDSITNSMDMNLSKLWRWRTEEPGVLQSMGSQRVRRDRTTIYVRSVNLLCPECRKLAQEEALPFPHPHCVCTALWRALAPS